MRVLSYTKGSGSIRNIINDVVQIQKIEKQTWMIIYIYSNGEIKMKTFSTKEFDIEVEFSK